MTHDNQSDRKAEVARQLNALFNDISPDVRPPLFRPGEKRFRISVGLFFLAVFCLLIAGFPWPKFEFSDRLIWVGFAVVMVLLGGWQLDKSNRETRHERANVEEENAAPPSEPPPSERATSLRSVK